MDCISNLQEEHWLIQRFLRHLHSLLDDAAIVGPWRPELELAVLFLEEFVGAFHDARETRVVFPFLVERGLDADSRGRPLVHEHLALESKLEAVRGSLERRAAETLEKTLAHLQELAVLREEHHVAEPHFHDALRKRLTDEDEQELAHRLRSVFPNAAEVVEHARGLLQQLGAMPKEPPALSA